MGRYIVSGGIVALSTAYKSGVEVFATSGIARRGFMMGLDFSQLGAPNATDCQIQYDMSRLTTPSTSMTLYTPTIADTADAACSATARIGGSGSTEPTITATSSVFNRSLNQRSSFRWDANDRLSALVFPASSNNGFALRGQNTVSGSFSGNTQMTATFEE